MQKFPYDVRVACILNSTYMVPIRDIQSLQGAMLCAVDIKRLVKVVLEHGLRDRGSDYYINGFAIDHCSDLLTHRQELYPDLCRTSIFAKTHQVVCAYVYDYFLHDVMSMPT